MWLVGMVARFKYYFAWTVSEAGLIFSGFCFNGFDEEGKARWDRYSNARIRGVEFSTSLAELPVHWNTCTGNFLRQCKLNVHLSRTASANFAIPSFRKKSRIHWQF